MNNEYSDGPETTIITPLYNAEKFLMETLLSILEQSYSNWEAILIDDNSSDNSLHIAREFARRDSRFKVINRFEGGGAARARNDGIQLARGRYIAFLDSDDVWLPDKLEKQIRYMKSQDIALSYTSYYFLNEKGDVKSKVDVPEKVTYHQLLKGNTIACLTAVYDTHKVGKMLMPDIRKRQDFGLWLKITKTGVDGYGFPEPLAYYRLREGSISSAKINTMIYTWRLYRDVEKLPLLSSIYYICNHLVGAFFKRVKNRFCSVSSAKEQR
ncbi:glycosyltransferase family 2 protein [Vibrio owensii]|uniref:glycosyltransferase family 2 protein n=1 Tax=Vibrio owensii TaxID=696485 RepID=UPI000EFA5650|nr:glycosyltransferase family 2 protein [Vibrio owensii]AYO21199.1 glycosyltransferase family 2 protein [Vibrio owensii]